MGGGARGGSRVTGSCCIYGGAAAWQRHSGQAPRYCCSKLLQALPRSSKLQRHGVQRVRLAPARRLDVCLALVWRPGHEPYSAGAGIKAIDAMRAQALIASRSMGE